MNNPVLKVAAVHDLSCFGRCSLTVIIPVLSCLGIQVCPLPTAVLSTHLGGYAGLEFRDFTEDMPAFFRHWKKEEISFDCIYSGFLASAGQIGIVQNFIAEFSANRPLVLVDPVMGDEGRLYSTYTPPMQEQMRTLVEKADIITPNYTEACFLLGETYLDPAPDSGRLREWARRLADTGPSVVVITGIPCGSGQIANLGFDKKAQAFWLDSSEHIPARYPGTGDIYASALLGCLLRGTALREAMRLAGEFTALAIKTTYAANTPRREGVLLESVLPWLGRNRG